MTIRFGTDGVRGRAFIDLTLDDAVRIGYSAGRVLGATDVVLARDTRESGPEFVAALARGFAAAGVKVYNLGVAPTPAVARVSQSRRIIGAMVSASHNVWSDNGIKLFAPGGQKLTDAEQAALVADMVDHEARDIEATVPEGPDQAGGPDPAVPVMIHHEVADWSELVSSSVPDGALEGMHVVLDAANGAGSFVSAPVLADLGATVTLINADPTGQNINENCGSTHPQGLVDAVLALGADVGIALDGDADRLVAVDADGRIVDGDQVIAICAIDLAERKALADSTVVVTVMSNLGFHLAMKQRGLTVVTTAVGDRHVLEALDKNEWSLGGEQSGHVIFHDIATTGDGLLTAVQLLAVVKRSGQPLAVLAEAAMQRLPQVLRNVRVDRQIPDIAELIAEEIARAESGLGERGRVLVRPSGTEPVIRVMVEAEDETVAESVCAELAGVVATRFG